MERTHTIYLKNALANALPCAGDDGFVCTCGGGMV